MLAPQRPIAPVRARSDSLHQTPDRGGCACSYHQMRLAIARRSRSPRWIPPAIGARSFSPSMHACRVAARAASARSNSVRRAAPLTRATPCPARTAVQTPDPLVHHVPPPLRAAPPRTRAALVGRGLIWLRLANPPRPPGRDQRRPHEARRALSSPLPISNNALDRILGELDVPERRFRPSRLDRRQADTARADADVRDGVRSGAPHDHSHARDGEVARLPPASGSCFRCPARGAPPVSP